MMTPESMQHAKQKESRCDVIGLRKFPSCSDLRPDSISESVSKGP
jgi:hypothetical protein